jgi:1-acyl-sn-glycerol-3-phosphate acyltransferase
MPDLLKRIYAFPFMIAICIWLSLSGFFAYPYFVLTGYKAEELRNFLYFQGKVVQLAIKFISFFNKNVVKTEFPKQPSVLVANHSCMCDTFVFFDFGVKNLVCIAKGWPFRIVFYGRYIEKAGYINSDNKTAEEIIQLALEKLKSGIHIGIFPEGTRQSKTGRFRSLAFEIALRSGCPVVPFAIKGLNEMLPRETWFPKQTSIKYIQLDAVLPEKFKFEAGSLKMAQHVKELIVAELQKTK